MHSGSLTCLTSATPEPQDVWDIILMIRSKSGGKEVETKRYNTIKRHIEMYDTEGKG